MPDIVRIDRTPRRPVSHRLPPIGDRPVTLTLHRNADRVVAAETTRATPTASPVPPLTERALAARFFPLMLAVVGLDLATKAWAVATLAGGSIALGPWLSLSLAFNRASAGGVSLGEHTRTLNFVATGLVVGLVVALAPALVRADRRGWRALALIAGAGLGNMASLFHGGRGVPDFIAVRHTAGAWVLNVADVALVVGLALLVGTVVRLARAALSIRRGSPVTAAPVVTRPRLRLS